jgi:hypothetical protein
MKGQGKTALKILFPVPHMTSDLVLLAEVGAIQDF